jgi:hypothetical protein
LVLTVMTGGSTEGNSRTPSSPNPMSPNSTTTVDITMARTGRRMLRE